MPVYFNLHGLYGKTNPVLSPGEERHNSFFNRENPQIPSVFSTVRLSKEMLHTEYLFLLLTSSLQVQNEHQ